MNPGHEELSRFFLELRDLPPDARERRLTEMRSLSPSLTGEVESMLRHDSDPPSILRTGARGGDETPPPPERIGPYRLLAPLGQGGMGEFFLAEQEEPLRRRVAVKILRSSASSAAALMRFEIERQVLARLSHPNVAKVFDAGTTLSGRPWFAMELVNGPCITVWCDQKRLPVRERLELFLQVCAGVYHAHQKAILHRDLKPGNVLVEIDGARATPKVIDFGVAKALDTAADIGGPHTRQGQLLGTPPYMSPEQVWASERVVDVRADVYALGAILYELLCGAPPLDLKGVDPLDIATIRRRVGSAVHIAPSRMVAAQPARVHESRRSDSQRLGRALRGDLDAIVLKALQREPADRYGSIPELADDIRRHLDHEPVRALPQTWRTGLRKAVRRHRMAASFMAAMTLVAIVTSTLAVRLDAARRRAEASERNAESYVRLLVEGYDTTGTTDLRISSRLDPAKLLEKAAENLERLPQPPETQVRLLRLVGDAHVRAGDLEKGRKLLARAGEEAAKLGPGGEVRRLEVQESQANLAMMESRKRDAEVALRYVIARSESLGDAGGRVRLEGRRDLGRLLQSEFRRMEARTVLEPLVNDLSAQFGPMALETLYAESYLGAIEVDIPELPASRLEGVLPKLESALGPRHSEVLIVLYNLAAYHALRGDHPKAMHYLSLSIERGLAIGYDIGTALSSLRNEPGFKELLHRHHLNQAGVRGNLESQIPLYLRIGNLETHAEISEELRMAAERVFGLDHPNTLGAAIGEAYAMVLTGRLDEAEVTLRRGLAFHHPDPAKPPEHPQVVADIHWSLAECLMGQGRRDEALEEMDLAYRFASVPSASPSYLAYLRSIQRLLRGDREGALDELRAALRFGPRTIISIERSLFFQELKDDPDFTALLATERHPYLF